MFTATIIVHHGGGPMTASATGPSAYEAYEALLSTALGIGYGPSGSANRAAVLIHLARHGHAAHGWADLTLTKEN